MFLTNFYLELNFASNDSIMMELVSSAISAVIVCFAEAPATFQKNHPELCSDMLSAWKDAYPDECADDFDTVKTY